MVLFNLLFNNSGVQKSLWLYSADRAYHHTNSVLRPSTRLPSWHQDAYPSSNQPRRVRSNSAIAAGSSTPITSPIAAMGTVNSLSVIS